MASANLQVLSEGQGYGLSIGLGIAFVVIMIGLTTIQNKFTSMNSFQSEEFNVASRSVKPGLIASGIVSAWTHPGTFLTACTLTYKYGLGGLIWQMGNGGFQILFFAMAAIKLKRVANSAHTFPELVKQKHGTAAHIVFTCYGLACNVISGATLIAGGAAAFSALTGVSPWAMYFIFPFMCTAYIVVGGLRSTFINDYLHTTILFVIIFVFAFEIYVVYPGIGSIDNLWTRLTYAATSMPAKYNYGGSYLTINSQTSLINNLSIFMSSFTSVWMDQAFWQRIIASDPHTTVRAYILGGWSWYGVPFTFATAIGLACIAVEGSPDLWPFEAKLTLAQVNAGLAAPAAIVAIMGQHGALILLVLLFMATTSSTSAEIIAASTVWTFDVHKTYIRPNANSNELVKVSMWALGGYSLILASASCLFHGVGISLSWLATCLAVLVGSGAMPLILILLWDRTSTIAATWGAPIGLFGGLITWLITTWKLDGSITVVTTLNTYNAVAGDASAIFISFITTILLTLIFPEVMETPEELDLVYVEKVGQDKSIPQIGEGGNEKAVSEEPVLKEQVIIVPQQAVTVNEAKSGMRLAFISLNIFFFVFLLIWPFALYGTHHIFGKPLFRFWIVISLVWGFCSSLVCVVLPLWESRAALGYIARGLVDGKRRQ